MTENDSLTLLSQPKPKQINRIEYIEPIEILSKKENDSNKS